MYKKIKFYNKTKKIKISHDTYTYLDNSVISCLKRKSGAKKLIARDPFTTSVLDRYFINKIIVTPSLFIEFIGKGGIKETIYEHNKKDITEKFENIITKALHNETVSIIEIENFYSFLELYCCEQLKLHLSPHKLSVLIQNEQKYHFIPRYKFVGRLLIKYGKNISGNKVTYEKFITDLVHNISISILIHLLTLKRKSSHEILNELNTKTISFLLYRYAHSAPWKSKIMMLIAGCYDVSRKCQTQKTLALITPKKDLADSEHQYLFFYGTKNDSISHRVNIFINEPLHVIEQRLVYYYHAGIANMEKFDMPLFRRLSAFSDSLFSGKIIVINPGNKTKVNTHAEIILTEEDLLWLKKNVYAGPKSKLNKFVEKKPSSKFNLAIIPTKIITPQQGILALFRCYGSIDY